MQLTKDLFEEAFEEAMRFIRESIICSIFPHVFCSIFDVGMFNLLDVLCSHISEVVPCSTQNKSMIHQILTFDIIS